MERGLLNLCAITLCMLEVLLSFVIISPLSILLRNFRGHCFLAADFRKVEINGTFSQLDVKWYDNSRCVFPEFMGFLMLFYALGYVIWTSCLIYKAAESSWRDSFIGAVLAGMMTFLLLIAASVLSSGLHSACNKITQHFDMTCENMSYHSEAFPDLVLPDSVRNDDFRGLFSMFKTAEVGCWMMFICSLLLTVVYCAKLKYNSGAEGFLTNLNVERERILTTTGVRRYDQI